MKLFKKTILLFCIVAGIVCFWLIPGINHATDTQYTRLYEDTDFNPAPGDTSRNKKVKEVMVVQSRPIVYKRESIKPAGGIKKIEAKMFSRAMQFEPEVEILAIDSANKKAGGVDKIVNIEETLPAVASKR